MTPINIQPDRPVVIAGPTASGKSALALHIAKTQGGVIVNADALQVFAGWPVLSAQPNDADQAEARHVLYGHIPFDGSYSVGHWLRDVKTYLQGARPIIVGGTGLYLTALTQGLADIPATPADLRAAADALPLPALLAALDPATRDRIDIANRVRVQRAWEVLKTTNRGLADWQDNTPPAILPFKSATCININAPKDWLTPRISLRCDLMLDGGALDEARAMQPNWDPAHLSSKAIGAAELMAYLRGDMTLQDAKSAIVIATRQYAKRQRTWCRKRMADWHQLDIASTDLSTRLHFSS